MAKWSTDGRWIAYLVQRSGEVQVWRSRVDGGKQEQLTRIDRDIVDFSWGIDGQTLRLKVARAKLGEFERSREQEATRGYLIDNRFDFDVSRQPINRFKPPTDEWSYDLAT